MSTTTEISSLSSSSLERPLRGRWRERMRHGARTRGGRGRRHALQHENRADQALHIVQTRQTRMRIQSVMDSCPESSDGKEVEFEPHFGCTIQAASVHIDGQRKQLTGDQGDNSKSGKAYQYHDNETGIASSDNKMKDLDNNPYLDHKDSGYMADFNGPGEKQEFKLEFSNSVQKVHTEQDDSCGDQKGDGSSICVTCEFDDRMVEDEVEHAFSFENKKTHDRIGSDVRVSASEGHQEVYKNDNINEESDIKNFICIGKSQTCFRTLLDCIWKVCCLFPRLISMDGDAALNDGPPSACSEFTQDINSEHRHMILVQRDIQGLQLLIGRETNALGHGNALVSELKQRQQKPDIKSKINQDQNKLNHKMNWFTSKNWDKAYDLGNCKPCIINILVYIVALEPRQNYGSNLVIETSLLPFDGQNVLAAASQTVDGHPNGRDSSNNSSQEPQREMDERINDPSNSPAIQCNDRDIGFTGLHLASGRVTEEDSGPTHPSAPVHESDLNIITSMESLRVSDVTGMTPLSEAKSQHSSGDTSCRDEGYDNGFQTDAGRHANDQSHLQLTEQAANGNPFHISAARSTQKEQPSEVNRINNTSASPVNSHGESGDPGSNKLQATRSTDPGNKSTTKQTYTVHVPARTSNEDDNSANAVEMASMNLASGGIRNTKEEASGRGQNENRGDATSIQETDSAQPKNPQYASRVQRIKSFQGWPARLTQRPEEMAECGFYYAGFNDHVHCFHCGIGLQDWLHEDDPWFEHARWSPSCFYVRKNKGNDFVQSAVRIAEMKAASKNATGKDSSNNGQESADGKDNDMYSEAEIEHEPDMNPDIFADIMRQHQELYDHTICRICLDRIRSVIFLPCGHLGTCTECSYFLQECPFCRSFIEKKIIPYC